MRLVTRFASFKLFPYVRIQVKYTSNMVRPCLCVSSLSPNYVTHLLVEEDFKRDQWKCCMVFVFMERWVYGKDGQKHFKSAIWKGRRRHFHMADLKFNMRAFEMWKRMESLVRLWYPSCHHTNLSCLWPGHESHRKISETGGPLCRPAEAQTSWARPLPERWNIIHQRRFKLSRRRRHTSRSHRYTFIFVYRVRISCIPKNFGLSM